MTTRQQPSATRTVDGHDHTEPAASAPDDTPPPADTVSVSDLVEEATEKGVVDWLADQIVEQCTPHGLPLDGDGGLLPALAVAAYEQITSRPSGPVKIELTYDPATQNITAAVERVRPWQLLAPHVSALPLRQLTSIRSSPLAGAARSSAAFDG